MDNLHTDILESLQEYDLPDVIEALCQLHDVKEITRLVESNQPQDEPLDSWEMLSCMALADEIIQACQKSQS